LFQIYFYCFSGLNEQREGNGPTTRKPEGNHPAEASKEQQERSGTNNQTRTMVGPKVSQPEQIPQPINQQPPILPSIPQPVGQQALPPLPFSAPPPTRGFDIGMLAALSGAGGHAGHQHQGFGPEAQAVMQRQMAELLAAGSPSRMRPPGHQQSNQVRKEPAGGPQFDLSALAALSGVSSIGPVGGPSIAGAINAEDLEASFHTESSASNVSGEDSGKEEVVQEERQGSSRPPPGFGGQQQLQEILGQIGNSGPVVGPVGQQFPGLLQHQLMQRHLQQLEHEHMRQQAGMMPGGITHEQLRKGNILPEQLAAGGILPEQLRTGAILPDQLRAGGILPEQLQAGGILPGQLRPPMMGGGMLPGFGLAQDMRQRHLSGDPLGIQSLANMATVDPTHSPFGPMMLPMIPLGLPQMGMIPFGGQNPSVSQMNPMGFMRGPLPGGLPPTPARDSPTNSPHPTEPTGWPTMFGPLAAGPSVPPFTHRETGFPSSVLFPGDLKHPLLHPATPPLEHYLNSRLSPIPTNGSNPLPIPPNSKPITPDVLLAEGSPMTPPNLNLHTFNFDD